MKAVKVTDTFFMETKSVQSYNNSFEQLIKDLKGSRKKNTGFL